MKNCGMYDDWIKRMSPEDKEIYDNQIERISKEIQDEIDEELINKA